MIFQFSDLQGCLLLDIDRIGKSRLDVLYSFLDTDIDWTVLIHAYFTAGTIVVWYHYYHVRIEELLQ